jgi:hypothetical protein
MNVRSLPGWLQLTLLTLFLFVVFALAGLQQ